MVCGFQDFSVKTCYLKKNNVIYFPLYELKNKPETIILCEIINHISWNINYNFNHQELRHAHL